MNDLKTLKDLAKTTILIPDTSKKHPCQEPTIPKEHTQTDELKQEAIKHIKELEKEKIDVGSCRERWNYADSKIEWIKNFFNLTEEDLELSTNSANGKVKK